MTSRLASPLASPVHQRNFTMVHPQSLNECAQMLICALVFCIWFFFFIVSFFGRLLALFTMIHHHPLCWNDCTTARPSSSAPENHANTPRTFSARRLPRATRPQTTSGRLRKAASRHTRRTRFPVIFQLKTPIFRRRISAVGLGEV